MIFMSKPQPTGGDLRDQVDAALRDIGDRQNPSDTLEGAASGAKANEVVAPTAGEDSMTEAGIGASNFFG